LGFFSRAKLRNKIENTIQNRRNRKTFNRHILFLKLSEVSLYNQKKNLVDKCLPEENDGFLLMFFF